MKHWTAQQKLENFKFYLDKLQRELEDEGFPNLRIQKFDVVSGDTGEVFFMKYFSFLLLPGTTMKLTPVLETVPYDDAGTQMLESPQDLYDYEYEIELSGRISKTFPMSTYKLSTNDSLSIWKDYVLYELAVNGVELD